MNILEYLHTYDCKIGLYTSSESMTTHYVKQIKSNQSIIRDYWNTNNEDIELDYLINFLFLQFTVSIIQEDNTESVTYENDFEYLNLLMRKYSIKDLVNFINSNYTKVFSKLSKYYTYGVKYQAITFIGNYKNQIKSDVITHIIDNHPDILLSNKAALKKIKKHHSNVYQDVFLKPKSLLTLIPYKLDEILEFLIDLNHSDKEFVKLAAEKLEWYVDLILNSIQGETIFSLQIEATRIGEFLHAIKYQNYREYSKKLVSIKSMSDDYIMNNGYHYTERVSSKKYDLAMQELDILNLPEHLKYLALTHGNHPDGRISVSLLEEKSSIYKMNLFDFSSTHKKTNSYFTVGRQNYIIKNLNMLSINLTYWINEDRLDKYMYYLGSSIKEVYDIVGSDLKESEHQADISDIKQQLQFSIRNNNTETKHTNSISDSCAYLEKVLRTIYIEIQPDAHFREDKITLGELLNTEDNPLKNLIGHHHMMWLRYILITDNGVGLNIRNKLAHRRDICSLDLSFLGVLQIQLLLVSSINSILINLDQNKSPSE